MLVRSWDLRSWASQERGLAIVRKGLVDKIDVRESADGRRYQTHRNRAIEVYIADGESSTSSANLLGSQGIP